VNISREVRNASDNAVKGELAASSESLNRTGRQLVRSSTTTYSFNVILITI